MPSLQCFKMMYVNVKNSHVQGGGGIFILYSVKRCTKCTGIKHEDQAKGTYRCTELFCFYFYKVSVFVNVYILMLHIV